MYFTDQSTTYYKGTQQCVTQSPFLILFEHKEDLYGIVRKVALTSSHA